MGLTFKYRPPHKKTVIYNYRSPLSLIIQYDDLFNNIFHEDIQPFPDSNVNLKEICINHKDITKEVQDFTFDRIGSWEVFIEDLVEYLRAKIQGRGRLKYNVRIELSNEAVNNTPYIWWNDKTWKTTKYVWWYTDVYNSKKEAFKIARKFAKEIKNGEWDEHLLMNTTAEERKQKGYHLRPVVISCTVTDDGEIDDLYKWYDSHGKEIN